MAGVSLSYRLNKNSSLAVYSEKTLIIKAIIFNEYLDYDPAFKNNFPVINLSLPVRNINSYDKII